MSTVISGAVRVKFRVIDDSKRKGQQEYGYDDHIELAFLIHQGSIRGQRRRTQAGQGGNTQDIEQGRRLPKPRARMFREPAWKQPLSTAPESWT